MIEEIIAMIKRGELNEGDKLPNQYDFAAELGVSRPSLREALNQLTQAGVVEQKPGAGTILKIGDPDLWSTNETPPLLSDTKATLELIQARTEIEPVAIKLAVDNMTEDDLEIITASINRMEEHYKNGDTESYMKEDVNFHYLISKTSHNRFILQMIVNLKRLMDQQWQESFDKLEGMVENSIEHHRKIYDALKSRNRDAAVTELRKHIEDIEKIITAYYKKNNML